MLSKVIANPQVMENAAAVGQRIWDGAEKTRASYTL